MKTGKLIYIKNIKHRLGKGPGFYFGALDINGRQWPVQFTLYEINMARKRALQNKKQLPPFEPLIIKPGRLYRGWAFLIKGIIRHYHHSFRR